MTKLVEERDAARAKKLEAFRRRLLETSGLTSSGDPRIDVKRTFRLQELLREGCDRDTAIRRVYEEEG